jgi:hypothetical protein
MEREVGMGGFQNSERTAYTETLERTWFMHADTCTGFEVSINRVKNGCLSGFESSWRWWLAEELDVSLPGAESLSSIVWSGTSQYHNDSWSQPVINTIII